MKCNIFALENVMRAHAAFFSAYLIHFHAWAESSLSWLVGGKREIRKKQSTMDCFPDLNLRSVPALTSMTCLPQTRLLCDLSQGLVLQHISKNKSSVTRPQSTNRQHIPLFFYCTQPVIKSDWLNYTCRAQSQHEVYGKVYEGNLSAGLTGEQWMLYKGLAQTRIKVPLRKVTSTKDYNCNASGQLDQIQSTWMKDSCL